MNMKQWWVRLYDPTVVNYNNKKTIDVYGRWVPTGCTDKDEAEFYRRTMYPGQQVKEWLQL
jgi:hypothetical protein